MSDPYIEDKFGALVGGLTFVDGGFMAVVEKRAGEWDVAQGEGGTGRTIHELLIVGHAALGLDSTAPLEQEVVHFPDGTVDPIAESVQRQELYGRGLALLAAGGVTGWMRRRRGAVTSTRELRRWARRTLVLAEAQGRFTRELNSPTTAGGMVE